MPPNSKPFRLIKQEALSTEVDLGAIHVALLWQWPDFSKAWNEVETEIKTRGLSAGDQLNKWNVCLNYQEVDGAINIHLVSLLFIPPVTFGSGTGSCGTEITLRPQGRSRKEVWSALEDALKVFKISKQPRRWTYSKWVFYFSLYKSKSAAETPYAAAKRLLKLETVNIEDPIFPKFESERSSIAKAYKVFDRMFLPNP